MKLFAIANAVFGGNILSLFLAALPGRCWLCFFFCLCPCCLQQLLEQVLEETLPNRREALLQAAEAMVQSED